MKKLQSLVISLLTLIILFGCSSSPVQQHQVNAPIQSYEKLEDIPEYRKGGKPYEVLNNNQPLFTDTDKKQTKSFENYSQLDELRRCGVAYALLSKELMPTEKRGNIGMIKPSGWQSVKYDNVDGKYLYNRCHLIGFQLAGENANERNLITGTRYMNTEGMLPFENMVADYIKETNNHVLYRVVPIFKGNNLVASGVTMEAYSIEDDGAGVEFYVYVHNVQPGIIIDYTTGLSSSDGKVNESVALKSIIGNKNTKVAHAPDCSSLPAKKNQKTFKSVQDAQKAGYRLHSCITK